MPNYRPRRMTVYNTLIDAGFLPLEAREFSRQYPSLKVPYIQSMMRWRRLYIAHLRYRGYSNKDIIVKINDLYRRRGWFSDSGILDPFKMLKLFRKKAIDEGEYVPPKRSHHPEGVSRGDVEGQKQRRRARGKVTRESTLQGKINDLNDQIRRAMIQEDAAERRVLETQRNRLQNQLDGLR